MSAGKKSHADSNYLTHRVTVRAISSADTDVDAIAEVIDTRFDETERPVVSGHHATLALFLLLDGITSADVYLYAKGDEEPFEEGSSSSSPSGVSEWCVYGSKATITANTMLLFQDMPAGQYKVFIDNLAGSGEVVVREQHSA
jgi:hypothetical protein